MVVTDSDKLDLEASRIQSACNLTYNVQSQQRIDDQSSKVSQEHFHALFSSVLVPVERPVFLEGYGWNLG